MLDKLEQIEARYEALTEELSQPEVYNDPANYAKLNKQHRGMGEMVTKYREWKQLKSELSGAKELFDLSDDEEMREMARSEMTALEGRLGKVEEDLRVLLLPRDPSDEATLFAAEMLRMYGRYAERQGWKMEILDQSESGIGGLKEAIAEISGDKVYSKLKHESGVHRVQRVPQTETSGRIHTSAVTVAVLPEAEEVDVKINQNDLRIDTFCSSGPGGQSVNTTYSAVRITHMPTGVVVSMQDEKSQIKNREKAMRVLRARLQELEEQKQHEAQASERRSMVGSGDRSEKIRTYNFKENRVTDHRIGLTVHQLELVMEGMLDEFVDALQTHYQTEKLKAEAVAV